MQCMASEDDYVYVYLFETKSIQSYLTRTGKLRDMISLSDMLVDLIDTSEDSWVRKVLKSCAINSNLSSLQDGGKSISPELQDNGLLFFRCKGGSFNCLSYKEEIIQSFRSTWTLFFQQAFPGMDFTDACCRISIRNFISELNDSFSILASSFNLPSTFLPYSTSVCQSTPVTGLAEVYNPERRKLGNFDLAQYRFNARRISQSSQNCKNPLSVKLYRKFLVGLNCSTEATDINQYIDSFNNYLDSKDKDIALIHMDGNGIGQTLQNLREQDQKDFEKVDKSNLSDLKKFIGEFVQRKLKFSELLGKATQTAVYKSLQSIIKEKSQDSTLIFRPLILGGDDITLLIEPRYALHFCKILSDEFKSESKNIFKDLTGNVCNVNECDQEKFLTMSGGVLFNKINHPYNISSSLVESLAGIAKKLTKKDRDPKSIVPGPAAVAFFRMSASSQEDISEIIKRSREHQVNHGEKTEKVILNSGPVCYYVQAPEVSANDHFSKKFDLNFLIDFIEKLSDSLCSKFKGRIRRMMTSISHGDLQEAEKIFNRMIKINENDVESGDDLLKDVKEIFPEGFYWEDSSEEKTKYQTILDDILVMIHYMRSKN